MKALFWLLKLTFFFVALTFAVKNTDIVTVRYYLGLEWQAPMIFVLLVVFCLGAVAGVVAGLGYVVRLRREVMRLRRQVSAQAAETKAGGVAPSAMPATSASNILDAV